MAKRRKRRAHVLCVVYKTRGRRPSEQGKRRHAATGKARCEIGSEAA